MARAIELAQRATGATHPNPIVGAVIVEDGQIVAEGWHKLAGQAHAEVDALSKLGRAPKEGARMYVTLEPCCTHGNTGACTNAIIASGIRHVIVGAVDPNPDHAGNGLEVLREAGVEVTAGVLGETCTDLNLIFNHWICKQRPFVALKIATTLDGKFGAANGYSKWITGEIARRDVMRWRQYFPAIAVTSNTVLADNPSLTVRLDGEVSCPQRFILDRQLKTIDAPVMFHVYTDRFHDQTTVVCEEGADEALKANVRQRGLKLWEIPSLEGRLDLGAFVQKLKEAGLIGLYLEAGPGLTTSLLEHQQIDYLLHYVAPKYMSDTDSPGIGSARATQSMEASIQLKTVKHLSFGDDFLLRGHV